MSSPDSPIKAAEAAKILGIGTSTVYRMVENRQLPCIRLGSAIRFRRATLESFIESQEAGSMKVGGQ
ncbi:MAG: helix-turn-helix domain-containing protein [Spirochaetia bacterium]|jgi:excisionase family DNA binding protein